MPTKRKAALSPKPATAKKARVETPDNVASAKQKAGSKKEAVLRKKNVKPVATKAKIKATKKQATGKKSDNAPGSKNEKSEAGVPANSTQIVAKTTPAAYDGAFSLKDLLTDERWKQVLAEEFANPYFVNLEATLKGEYKAGKKIFPPKDLIFNALHLTPLDKVKVVMLGQDPYHDDGQAMGMSFSVPKGIAVPPSLKNIYTELERDPKISGFKRPDHGCLENWAKEGILMINATLTVEAHKPNSHAKYGWQTFTDSIIKAVSDNCDHVVFILWGGFAHKKESLIDLKKHVAIKTAHPSPLSLNKFKNCNCFSDCDAALIKFGLKPINWSLN